jgi:hypothetical protein
MVWVLQKVSEAAPCPWLVKIEGNAMKIQIPKEKYFDKLFTEWYENQKKKITA